MSIKELTALVKRDRAFFIAVVIWLAATAAFILITELTKP